MFTITCTVSWTADSLPGWGIHNLLFQVDDKIFSGEAKSKKEAKKLAAVKALAELYGIQY